MGIFSRKNHKDMSFPDNNIIKNVEAVGQKRSVDNYNNLIRDAFYAVWDGEKFPGSFGLTKNYQFVDYWTLRERSYQLFVENIYARGLLRRLLRNEIHTGIVGSANIVADVIWQGMEEQACEEKGVKFF